MTKQHLTGLRTALVGAAIAAVVFVPMTSTLAQQSLGNGATGQVDHVDSGDNITRPQLYPRANYVWPFATGPHYGDVVADVPGTIRTPVGSFHLSQGELPFPSELSTPMRLAQTGVQHFIVQIHPDLEVGKSVQRTIEASGGKILAPIGDGSMVVELNIAGYAAIQDSVGILGVVPYHAAFKLHPSIGRTPLPDPIKANSSVYNLDVLLWHAEDGKMAAERMTEMGANVTGVWGNQIRVEADRSLLVQMAQLESVQMIFEALPQFLWGEETTTTVQTGQYNGGAIPYHDAFVNGGGNGTMFCSDPSPAYTPCEVNGDCTATGGGTCTVPAVQVLMVLDSGIQLDAGDLSDTRTNAGVAGSSHRKVRIYEATNQFGGTGDLIGCDAPLQGGFTHGSVVSAVALGNGTDVGVGYGSPWFLQDSQSNDWKVDGIAHKAQVVMYDGQRTPPSTSCGDTLLNTVTPGDLWNAATPTASALGKAYVTEDARLFNFSWGTPANDYDNNALDVDQFIAANRDAMVIIAAGNNGEDVSPADGIPDEFTLGTPATAKNSLAIGASQNANLGIPSPETREAFSSMGPAVDRANVNRIAPQLMAPGGEPDPGGGSLGISSEFACRSSDNDQDDPVECDKAQGVEGTSFSAPAASGAGLVVRDYFAQGFYPDKSQNEANRSSSISGSLVKAILVSSANYMTGGGLTRDWRFNNEQGYGRIQLDRALPLENWPPSPTGIIVHDPFSLTSGMSLAGSLTADGTTTDSFVVCNDTEDLTVVLAWVDVATDPIGRLQNDLDLEITSPTGKKYRGNYFTDDANRDGSIQNTPFLMEDCPPIGSRDQNLDVDTGGWSLPTCANSKVPGKGDIPQGFDTTNPTEAIFLSADPEGNTNDPNYVANFLDGICDGGSSAPGGVNGLGLCGNDQDCAADPTNVAMADFCNGGTRQPEIGDWDITITAKNTVIGAQDFAVAIVGGVCVGSSVRFTQGAFTCNDPAQVQVSEFAEAGDPGCDAVNNCSAGTVQSRTTVQVFSPGNPVAVDCEGPECPLPSAGLTFTRREGSFLFTSDAINLTDGTVPQSGNGTLDVRDGDTIEVVYADEKDGGSTVIDRRSSAFVGCQVALGFGAATFIQFGQDTAVLVQGGCERALPRHDRCVNGFCAASDGTDDCEEDVDCPYLPNGFFEYGFPDRYMDADELIQFNVAFNSEETTDLSNVSASMRCVNVDQDSPADCLPSGANCDPLECGGGEEEADCDPRRENNTACPYMSVLNSPQFLGLVPTGELMTANFAIQMAPDGLFGGTTPTVEMLLELTADTSGKTASGIAVTRQRLNVDTEEKLYNTDFPTGGINAEILDHNNNERQDDPINDLSGFQGFDYRFETKSYSDMTATGRNLNLLSPWNFDGNSGGFRNGLNSTTTEAGAQSNLIANWGEDKNFNGVEDGTCVSNPSIACWSIGTDPRCPGAGTCQSIEDNNADTNFTQNHSTKGGCGWQTKAPHTCSADSSRGCHENPDCQGTCQLSGNSILSTFTPCSGACPQVQQCDAVLSDYNVLGSCDDNLDCAGQCSVSTGIDCSADEFCPGGETCVGVIGACASVPQTCEDNAGTCDMLSTNTTGGVWHTGIIGDPTGDCTTAQCRRFKVITTDDNNLSWWELLVTPVMEKVDQSESEGLPNSNVNIAMWGWNQSADLPDNRIIYTWEFDTDTETLFPVDLVSDGTVLDSAGGGYGAVTNENNPQLTNGFNLFAPMGRCTDQFCTIDDRPCVTTSNCALDVCPEDGFCSESPDAPCTADADCTASEEEFCQFTCTLGANVCTVQEDCTAVQTCPGTATPTGACQTATDCVAGTCSAPAAGEPCNLDGDCAAIAPGSVCEDNEGCAQLALSYNGQDNQGNNRVGQNSCFFENGTITADAFDVLGTAKPIDNDRDDDGDGLIDEFVTAAGPLRNTDIVSFNGSDMRLFTLEDLFQDTGNKFQAALGFLNLEGQSGNSASQGFGLAVDDMFVEWVEFVLNPDGTTCDNGQCAVMEVPSGQLYEGVTSVPVSLLDDTPYGFACVGGPSNGERCFSANGNSDCAPGICQTAENDCDFNGLFNDSGDDDDCDDNGIPDVVTLATSEVDFGEILVLNQEGVGSNEYSGTISVSVLADSEGVLFLSQVGEELPTVTVTYDDNNDGTGNLCQNSVIPDSQGRVQAFATVNVQACDVQVVSTSFTDNGDGDLFADSSETISLDFSVQNNCGFLLTNCIARMSSNSPEVECIKQGTVVLGDLQGASSGTPPVIPSPSPFLYKLDDEAADRTTLAIGPNAPLNASFNIAISCDQIDGLQFPQNFSTSLDLNLNDNGQDPTSWIETFEGGGGAGDPFSGTAFENQNNDGGIPGNSNAEGLVNGDGWRCAYTDPDWVNSSSYNQSSSLDCFPGMNLAHSNQVFWQIDGQGIPGTPDGGRAKGLTRSMYYGIFLNAPDDDFTTPMASVEAAATHTLINLGVDDPQFSFWHQVSLADHRFVGIPDRRSADRAVVQIKLFEEGGAEASAWMNLQPFQNAYDDQNADNFFNCEFDPVDDGNTEDDFFDPTDPDRDDGPSSTCFPEFTWAWMGSTTGTFNVADIGHATTPPASSDAPDLGDGTWIETRIDLSQFRGRRAKIRYMVTGIKATAENHNEQFGDNNEVDDGWWVDDLFIDEVLLTPASFENDDFVLGTCSVDSSTPCIGQCKFSGNSCSNDSQCGLNEPCLAPCPSPQTCLPVPPACGAVCTETTARAFVTPADVLNPGTVPTAAPGQVLTINGSAPVDIETGAEPSSADACLSGNLQFQFCRDGDPLGGGPNAADGDCADPEDLLIRAWTENAVLTVAPQESAAYTMQVRCSSKTEGTCSTTTAVTCQTDDDCPGAETCQDCIDSEVVNVDVTCPGGDNALGLKSLFAVYNEVASQTQLSWLGSPLDVDVWTSPAFGNSSALANYPGSTFFATGANAINLDALSPGPGLVIAILVKADGALNTIPVGYFCNSRTWRSGGTSEIPESGFSGLTSLGRDISIGDPTP